MRRLVLFLLAINFLYALWHVVRPPPPSDESPVRLTEEVGTLVLLSELTVAVPVVAMESAMAAEVAVILAQESVTSDTPERDQVIMICAKVSQFSDDAGLAQFLQEGVGSRPYLLRTLDQALPPLHRVYLPAAADRAEALSLLAMVRETIEQADARIDTYLIVGGEFDNVVSLGLFGEPANAANVQRILTQHGYQPQIQIENRERQIREVLVEFEKDSDFEEKTLQVVEVMGLSVELTENLCEMIALQG